MTQNNIYKAILHPGDGFHILYYIFISMVLLRILTAVQPITGIEGFKYQANDTSFRHWFTLLFMLGTWSNLWDRIELRFFLLAQLIC